MGLEYAQRSGNVIAAYAPIIEFLYVGMVCELVRFNQSPYCTKTDVLMRELVGSHGRWAGKLDVVPTSYRGDVALC